MIRKTLIAGVVFAGLALSTTGCNEQQTAAELIGTLGTAVTSLETLEGGSPALVAKIQADTTAAETAVTNWKSGTPCSDVVEALNLVDDDLNLLPTTTADDALINFAIGVTEQILSAFPACAPTATASVPTATAAAVAARVSGAPLIPHRTVATVTVKSSKDFKKQWNAIVAKNATLAPAAVK